MLKLSFLRIDFPSDQFSSRSTFQLVSIGFNRWIQSENTLETVTPEFEIPNHFLCEDRAFLESITTREKNRGNVDRVLETARLLDALYHSAEIGKEVDLTK